MCDLDKEFKLCTCAGEKLEIDDIDWILYRVDNSLPILHRKGKVKIQEYTNKEEKTKDKIVEELNDRNCFDFDFEPRTDDFIRMRIKKKALGKGDVWAAFRFGDHKWRKDASSSLAGWRSQLFKFNNGKIKKEC